MQVASAKNKLATPADVPSVEMNARFAMQAYWRAFSICSSRSDLLAKAQGDVDIANLQLVADAFLRGRSSTTDV